jgi:PKHD-type hydroxylase
MQSMIRDTEKRELLVQLKTVQEMIGARPENKDENLMMQQVYSNLVRMWAEL